MRTPQEIEDERRRQRETITGMARTARTRRYLPPRHTTQADALVYAAVRYFCTRSLWEGAQEIGEAIGRTAGTVRRHVHRLKELGYVTGDLPYLIAFTRQEIRSGTSRVLPFTPPSESEVTL